MVFMKEIFKKVDFEKNQLTTKKHEKLPRMCAPFHSFRDTRHNNVCLDGCLFDLILYVPVNNLSVMSGWVFLG